jgi:hemerythrin
MNPVKICFWTKKYSIGIDELDSHHQQLFDILNEVFNAINNDLDAESIISILDKLKAYTHYHFSEEEIILAAISYPDLELHQQLHQEFIQKLEVFYQQAQNGNASLVAIKVANFGLEWLRNHILTVDRKYYDYMKREKIFLYSNFKF